MTDETRLYNHIKSAKNKIGKSFIRTSLSLGCDSVGIRTQDPQLRRLLLYPAELPNRSVLLLGSAGLIPKVGANIDVFVVICKI